MHDAVAGIGRSDVGSCVEAFGRETLWDFSNVEAEKVKLLVPKAPLTWLNSGTLDVLVTDRWSLSEDWVDMDWQIGMKGMKIDVPRDAGTTEKLLSGSLAQLVKARAGNADFRYQLTLDKAQIGALRAGNLDQFWDTVLAGFLKSGGKGLSAGADQSDDPDTTGDKPSALDKLKGLFNKKPSE